MESDQYPKESKFVLDCCLDEAVSTLETFWANQKALEPLKLQKDDGPPGMATYRVTETVGGITNRRAVLRFVHRWQDKRTDFTQRIYLPGGHTDGLFFPARGRYPSFPEATLVKVLEKFRVVCPSKSAEPEPAGDGYSHQGKTMADRVIFCLNTSAYNFAQWLERHTGVEEFPTKRGRFVLQRARAGGSFCKPDRVTIDSAYITPSRDDEQLEIGHYPVVEAVHFSLTDIGTERDSRIEVDALCINSFPPIRAYFHDLLADIARTWSESAQPIGELAQASARETGVDTLQPAAATPSGDHAGEGERAVESTPLLEDWPAWMPQRTNGELLQIWSDIASIWEDMQEEYRDELVRDSKPRLEDLRERVIEELGVTYSIRRLSTILRAKKGGYLDQAQRKKKRRV